MNLDLYFDFYLYSDYHTNLHFVAVLNLNLNLIFNLVLDLHLDFDLNLILDLNCFKVIFKLRFK